MSSLDSQAHAFPQPVCERLFWLNHWSISPSEWGPNPQCQATQVVHWTRWWQCLVAWHCRSADHCHVILLQTLEVWFCQWPSLNGMEHCTLHTRAVHTATSWKRGGLKRELVAATWTSSRQFSHMLWLKVHSHLLLRACLLRSKRKLPPPACQVWLGLPSAVCRPRGMQFLGTMYICNQGLLSSAWAHCISCAPSACSHCRRCCCCPLPNYQYQYSRTSMHGSNIFGTMGIYSRHG